MVPCRCQEIEQKLPSLKESGGNFSHLLPKQYVKQILHYTQNASTTINEKPGSYQFLRNFYNLCYSPIENIYRSKKGGKGSINMKTTYLKLDPQTFEF